MLYSVRPNDLNHFTRPITYVHEGVKSFSFGLELSMGGVTFSERQTQTCLEKNALYTDSAMVTPPSCTFVEAALLCLWASSNDWKCRMEQNSSWISKFTERWRISRAWEFPNEFPKTFLSIRFSVGISGKFFYLTEPLCNWWKTYPAVFLATSACIVAKKMSLFQRSQLLQYASISEIYLFYAIRATEEKRTVSFMTLT